MTLICALATSSPSLPDADRPPVMLQSDSRFIVRGRITSTARIYLGFDVSYSNGERAGKFRAEKPASEFSANGGFEAVFRLSEFAIDPDVRGWKDQPAANPEGLVVKCVWCFTSSDQAAKLVGLEVTEIELVPRGKATHTK